METRSQSARGRIGAAQSMRAAVIALVLVASGAGPLVACRSAPGLRGRTATRAPEAQEFYDQARQLRSEGRHEEALLMLSRAIEQNPEFTVAHVELGEMHYDRGQYARAERELATAARQMRQRPADPILHFRAEYKHGLVLQIMGRLAEAIRAYVRALNIDSESFDANLGAATAYLQLSGHAQARRYAERAVALNPASGEAHANLGAAYSGLAMQSLRAGRADEASAMHRMAVREYESAAELMMLRPGLLMNWADSLGRLGRYEEMTITLRTVIRIEAQSALAWERLGYAQFKMGDYQASMQSFRESLLRDRSHYPAHNGIGVCLLNDWLINGRANEQNRALAVAHLRASLRVNPGQGQIVELVSRYGR